MTVSTQPPKNPATRQITMPPTTIDCSAVKYTLGKSVGHVLRNAAGENLLYLFAAHPKTTPLPSDAPVLFAKGVSVDQDFIWLLSDNNGMGRKAKLSDKRPTLFRCPKPQ